MKVGGHQASCASVVSLMTTLYFAFLRPRDHIAVKLHASPVFHAIQYLLGNLPQHMLTTLQDFGGLQAYPSRTKDPDGVTISTGSVGLGAAATIFGALTQRYVRDHFGLSTSGRYIALVGDAELDEGNVPEALGEASAYGLHDLWWIVDINRQSLDHIAPDGQVVQIARMFEAKGWEVLMMNLGGHDISQILRIFETAAKVQDRPVAILAYTIKGRGLPIARHIENHAAQLTSIQITNLQEELGIAENNFDLTLAMFGLAHELHGELLLPVGTVYDPFVARGLDALTYATYKGCTRSSSKE